VDSDREILFDTVEAARFLKQRPRVLEAWRYRNVGPRYIKFSHDGADSPARGLGHKPGSVRYRKADLIAFLDQQTVEPARATAAVA
jgi:hypothetical protein